MASATGSTTVKAYNFVATPTQAGTPSRPDVDRPSAGGGDREEGEEAGSAATLLGPVQAGGGRFDRGQRRHRGELLDGEVVAGQRRLRVTGHGVGERRVVEAAREIVESGHDDD